MNQPRPALIAGRDLMVFGLLMLPVLIHAALLGRDIAQLGFVPISWLDYVLIWGVIVYLSVVALVMRRPLWSRRFCLVVYGFLLPLVGLEIYGMASGFHNVPWTPQLRRSQAHPDLPGLAGEIVFSTNFRGVRAPDSWPERREDRVLCVGGSTTECILVTDEKTWPWLLGQELSEDLGREILVANAGRSGHFTGHHIYQLQHYRHADKFGTVIALVGINDATTFTRGNLDEVRARVPADSLMRSSGKRAYFRGTVALELFYGIWKSSRFNSRYAIRQDGTGAGVFDVQRRRRLHLEQNTIDRMPPGLEAALLGYRDRIRQLVGICRQRNQRIVLLTQPTLYQREMPVELEPLLCEFVANGAHTPAVLAELMDAYNETLKSVCRELDVPCIDLAAKLPKDTTVFYDDCHFNISGCRQVVDVLRPLLKEHLAGQP